MQGEIKHNGEIVEFEYYPGSPGRTWGHPDTWYPGDPSELIIHPPAEHTDELESAIMTQLTGENEP